jgi:hypothetical protein
MKPPKIVNYRLRMHVAGIVNNNTIIIIEPPLRLQLPGCAIKIKYRSCHIIRSPTLRPISSFLRTVEGVSGSWFCASILRRVIVTNIVIVTSAEQHQINPFAPHGTRIKSS